MTSPKKVTLKGGTWSGKSTYAYSWQPIIHMSKRITKEEYDALRIDESTSWRVPDEVYERNSAGEYVYARTINYKPDAEIGSGTP